MECVTFGLGVVCSSSTLGVEITFKNKVIYLFIFKDFSLFVRESERAQAEGEWQALL